MPIKDVAAQVASLSNDYGATKGPNAPVNLDVEIWVGDPLEAGSYEMPATTDIDGVVTANGYASVTVPNDGTTWNAPDPVTGELLSNPITFPTSTAEWPDTGTHWLLRDTATGDAWDCAAFERTQRVNVNEAGVTPKPILSIFYNNLTE